MRSSFSVPTVAMKMVFHSISLFMLMLDTEKELYYYGPNKVIGRRNSSTHPLPLPFRYELNLATDASNFLKATSVVCNKSSWVVQTPWQDLIIIGFSLYVSMCAESTKVDLGASLQRPPAAKSFKKAQLC